MKTYAVIYENAIREHSSSGGIFSALASQFEVVYGVAMTEDCYGAEMIRVEGDVSALRSSKYVQAKLGDSLKKVKGDLSAGKKVLFSGTGCQINGLKNFLEKDYDNLLCVDVVCHGVPSPKLWREYVKFQESKHGKLKQVNFRAKEEGWKKFGMRENQLYIPRGKDPFMNMFLDDFCLRPSCYDCQAKQYRLSDITIADFWGINNIAPEMNDGKGTSLVIVRTEKGRQLFESIKNELKWKEVSYDDGVRENPAEYQSATRPPQRDTFFVDLGDVSFESMIKKYASDINPPLFRVILRRVKKIAKKIVRGGVETNSDYGLLFVFRV